jgi:hypothetical protein
MGKNKSIIFVLGRKLWFRIMKPIKDRIWPIKDRIWIDMLNYPLVGIGLEARVAVAEEVWQRLDSEITHLLWNDFGNRVRRGVMGQLEDNIND